MQSSRILFLILVLSASTGTLAREDKARQHGELILKEHVIPVPREYKPISENSPDRERLIARVEHWGKAGLYDMTKRTDVFDVTTVIDILSGLQTSLPVSENDVIARAVVMDYQPYFSADKSTIWMQFSATIGTVFRQRSDMALQPGSPVVFERQGGAIRDNAARGRVYSVKCEQIGFPRIREELFLFLKGTDPSSFQLSRSYLVRDGRVFPLESFSDFELADMPVDQFEKRLREAVR